MFTPGQAAIRERRFQNGVAAFLLDSAGLEQAGFSPGSEEEVRRKVF